MTKEEVLKQEPCEDAVSREAVMHILDEVGGDFDSPREAVVPIDYIADMVSELPSVSPQPCDDAISRQAVLEKAINVPIAKIMTDDKVICRKVIFVDDVEKLPPVSPQPKMGRWKAVKHYGRDYYKCTCCSMERKDDHSRGWNYCPFCGAKMSGDLDV